MIQNAISFYTIISDPQWTIHTTQSRIFFILFKWFWSMNCSKGRRFAKQDRNVGTVYD